MEKYHKIGIISDTHGLLRPEVAEMLKGCEAIFHAGDVGKKEILDVLGQIAPVYAVRGNNDGWAFCAQGGPVSQPQTKGMHFLPDNLSVELFGIRFFMTHDKADIPKEKTGFDVIIYGHSHKYEELHLGKQLMLNPGSCGPKRFALPVTMAVMEAGEDGSFLVKRIELGKAGEGRRAQGKPGRDKEEPPDMGRTVKQVMRDTEKGMPVDKIAEKRHISRELAEQICRLYLTHPGVDAEGIMRKMGLS